MQYLFIYGDNMNNDRLLNRFLRYVKCSSESRNEKEFCLLVEDELKKLGFEVYRDEVGHNFGSNGWNIIASLPGKGEPMLFSCHLDTVTPGIGVNPVIKDGVIYSDGTTILGSDDKSGIAAVLEAAESIIESGKDHRPIEVMFSLCEELGLLGAKFADYSKIKSKTALVLDSGLNGCIINQAPAQMKMHFDITGKASHAGAAPEKGIHALKAAADAIYNIPCGHVDDCTVMNVSNFISEGPTNVVAAKATFDMELRSFDDDLFQSHFEEVIETVKRSCEKYGATFEYTHEIHSGSIYIPEDTPFVQDMLKKYEQLGRPCSLVKTYGGCDVTWLVANGIQAVNIGTGMQEAHSVTEHIAIADLEFTTRLVESIMLDK